MESEDALESSLAEGSEIMISSNMLIDLSKDKKKVL
jgi:hypothetical protein